MVTMNSRQVVEQAKLMPSSAHTNIVHVDGYDRVTARFDRLQDAEMFAMFIVAKVAGYRGIGTDGTMHTVVVLARPAR